MPTADTVAKLNRIGGKGQQSHVARFQVSTEALFSPEKEAQAPAKENAPSRSSGRLQTKRLSEPGASIARRSSFSVPEDHEVDPAPAPKPKKKVALKKSKKTNDQSPMKKHGYNVQLQENSEVNLADSPAKNTRSKNLNPLEALAQANLPIPESLAKKNNIQIGTRKKPSSSTAVATPDSPLKRKVAEASISDEEGASISVTSDTKRVRTEDEGKGDEEEVAEQSTSESYHDAKEREDSLEAAGDEVVPAEVNTIPKKNRGRPRKNNETDQEREQRLLQAAIRAQEQRIEAEAALNKSFQSKREQFAKDVSDAIQSNDCAILWMDLGGAAGMIRTLAPPTKAASVRGRAVMRCIKRLLKAYHAIGRRPTSSQKQEEHISTQLNQLNGLCNLLQPTEQNGDEDQDEDLDTVKDMFLFIIPRFVTLLKFFLRARYQEEHFDHTALKELMQILNMLIHVCERARQWEPRPNTLDPGIRRWVRNYVLADLKRLVERFQPVLTRLDGIAKDRMFISALRKKQAIALEGQRRKKQAILSKRRDTSRTLLPRTIEEPRAMNSGDASTENEEIPNVDDTDDDTADYSAVLPSREKVIPHTTLPKVVVAPIEPTPRLLREPTADLPPPLSINLSEDEETALLNGLQRYSGEYRYNEILNDNELGQILRTRDLDDLIKAARSFSQMMASKLGVAAYRADDSLWWLRSTDPDEIDPAGL